MEQPAEQRPRGRSIFVGNLPPRIDIRDIQDLFSRFGRVDHIDMKEKFAFVFMEHDDDGEAAIRALNRSIIHNHTLLLDWAKGDSDIKRREESRRAKAMTEPTNTLFVVGFNVQKTTTRDLAEAFGAYGTIHNIEMRSSFAFVQFETVDEATAAFRAMQGHVIHGAAIQVEYRVTLPTPAAGPSGPGGPSSSSSGPRFDRPSSPRRRPHPSSLPPRRMSPPPGYDRRFPPPPPRDSRRFDPYAPPPRGYYDEPNYREYRDDRYRDAPPPHYYDRPPRDDRYARREDYPPGPPPHRGGPRDEYPMRRDDGGMRREGPRRDGGF